MLSVRRRRNSDPRRPHRGVRIIQPPGHGGASAIIPTSIKNNMVPATTTCTSCSCGLASVLKRNPIPTAQNPPAYRDQVLTELDGAFAVAA